MTAYYGVNETTRRSITPSDYLEASQLGGKIRAIVETWQGAIDTASILYFGKMPKGALPLGGSILYSGSSTATLSFGYTGATQYLGTATALATTKTQRIYPNKSQWNTPLTADAELYISVNTKALAASDKLCIVYEYAME